MRLDLQGRTVVVTRSGFGRGSMRGQFAHGDFTLFDRHLAECNGTAL
jgi:hypothetical protein